MLHDLHEFSNAYSGDKMIAQLSGQLCNAGGKHVDVGSCSIDRGGNLKYYADTIGTRTMGEILILADALRDCVADC